MSSLQKKVLMPRGLPPRPQMSTRGSNRGARGGRGGGRVYTPLHWKKYFSSSKKIEVGKSVFNVYLAGDNEGPLLVFLHGGGYSGLTWAPLTSEITRLAQCQVLSIDLRGHGCSVTEDEYDLSPETMAKDISCIVEEHVKSLDKEPEVVLIGHSMGGALAVHTALEGQIDNLIGLVVVDVVEGTAMDALTSMQSFLRGRPKSFPSLDHAIEWALRSAQVRNNDSARVSMPGQLVNAKSNQCAVLEVPEEDQAGVAILNPSSSASCGDAIKEESEEGDEEPEAKQFKAPEEQDKSSYTWRIDLGKTEPHWSKWFTDLSNKFLDVPASKLLVLAGVDRLDRNLTVGQMQGKFQMQILPQAGHAVHEDVPEKMAEVMATFLIRNKFAVAKEDFLPSFPAC